MIITESDNQIFMTTQSISLTEAARNFSDCINRVAYRGETFLLLRGRRAVAEIRPAPIGRRRSELAGLLASLPSLTAAEASSWQRELQHQRLRA
jgi:antitoxin (DNA-binding transcriptional repressor) of toxin-antitoxin stability system